MSKITRKARVERKQQILQMARAVVVAAPHKPVKTLDSLHPYLIAPKTHFTVGDMARWLDLAPSTKLRDILWELVDSGHLRLTYVPYRKRGVCYEKAVFCLPEYFIEQMAIDF